jgi:hypothetical protein
VRRPVLWTIVGLLLVVAGFSAATYGIGLTYRLRIWDNPYRAAEAFTAISMVLTLGGLVLAAIAFVVYRKREELRAGTGIVARWRVGMLEWAAFRHRDAARSGLFHSLRNRLRLPADLPPEGLEIRIGQNAMLVGDACYGLGYFASRGKLVDVARVEGQPAMLEFTTHQQGRNSSRLAIFRVPVPEGARAGAQVVLDHFDRAIDPDRRDSIRSHYAPHFQAATGDAGEAEAARAEDRRRNWGAWGFSFLIGGGLLLAILRWNTPGPNADQTAIQILTIGGGVLAAAGLLALVVSVLTRRRF